MTKNGQLVGSPWFESHFADSSGAIAAPLPGRPIPVENLLDLLSRFVTKMGRAQSERAPVGNLRRPTNAGASTSVSPPGREDEVAPHSSVASSAPDEQVVSQLVARLGPDDSEAFPALFELYRQELRVLCRRLLSDVAGVDDALNEIFLRAHRGLRRYDRDRPFRPWIRSIATNHCIDQLRKHRFERGLFHSENPTQESAADDAPSVLSGITQREQRAEVLAALDALAPKYRIPLVLRFYKDLDYEAIAGILGVTRNQVGTLLFRGKSQLRRELLARSEQDLDGRGRNRS